MLQAHWRTWTEDLDRGGAGSIKIKIKIKNGRVPSTAQPRVERGPLLHRESYLKFVADVS
jgi:hypothetical protein